jgi:hypothetical protein
VAPTQTVAGARYTFTHWEDGSTAATRPLTAPSSSATYTASFAPSYLLLTNAGPGGTVSAGGWVAAGTNTTITATPSPGYYFQYFDGTTFSFSNPLTIPATPFMQELAIFAPQIAQTIAFHAAPSPAVAGTGFVAGATGGGSSSPVTFTSATTSVCTVSGANGASVSLIAAGTCTLTANQAGDVQYLAAPSASLSFTVFALSLPPGTHAADAVYGQGGSFTTGNLGTTATSLNQPSAVAFDSVGNLYVADTFNSRVLYYPAGSTTATRVYGQGGSFSSNDANHGGVSANSLYYPFAVALDSVGNLYVADFYNNRVLYYPAGSTTATRVYGQGGDFTAHDANQGGGPGGAGANSLAGPAGVALDGSGNLYVADASNNRVLYTWVAVVLRRFREHRPPHSTERSKTAA